MGSVGVPFSPSRKRHETRTSRRPRRVASQSILNTHINEYTHDPTRPESPPARPGARKKQNHHSYIAITLYTLVYISQSNKSIEPTHRFAFPRFAFPRVRPAHARATRPDRRLRATERTRGPERRRARSRPFSRVRRSCFFAFSPRAHNNRPSQTTTWKN